MSEQRRRRRTHVSAAVGGARWTPAQAEQHLRSLELFGMRFGLERMRRLTTALGSPQQNFSSIHVVGTNGKSSTTRMIAAMLQASGLRTGAYLSPHLRSYAERLQIAGADIAPEQLADALERTAHAAGQVNRTLAEDDHVTQFELLSAAALWELARRQVDVAVIEAGLGGRFDATNVIGAAVCALTNVSLEHTRWLGPTIADIAAEKLAVVPDGGTLVLGPQPQAAVLQLAQQMQREHAVRLFIAQNQPQADSDDLPPQQRLGPPPEQQLGPPYQQHNFATAELAARCFMAQRGAELPQQALKDARSVGEHVSGRFEIVRRRPLTIFDGAHNHDAARALREALRSVPGHGPVGLVLGVLEDKDAASMLRELLPCCERAWFTVPPDSRALSPATLQSLARQLGFDAVVCQPQAERALKEAWQWAQEAPVPAVQRPAAGVSANTTDSARMVLATGSIYLIGELMRTFGEHLDGVEPQCLTADDLPAARRTGSDKALG